MSDSNSETTETISSTDNRKVLGAGGSDASNGGTISNWTQTNTAITDGGAIAMAGKALDSSLSFADGVVDANSKSLTSALNFAGDVVGGAFNFGERSLKASLTASNDAYSDALGSSLTFGAKVTAAAINSNADALAGSLAFGTKTANAAFNASTDALNEALSASRFSQQQSANQVSDALSFAQGSSTQSAAAQRQALDKAMDSMGFALAFGGKQTSVAIDSLNSSSGLVKDAYADAKGRGALTDKILIVSIVMAGLVAFFAVKK